MELDEAIKHAEKVAESKEKQVKNGDWEKDSVTERNCVKCAEEHRQLAEWLKELKAYKAVHEESTLRLIDANALASKKFLNPRAEPNYVREIYQRGWNDAIDAIVDNAPTIKTFTLADIEEQYRNGLEKGLEEAEPKKCPICGNDLYEYCFMCCYEGKKVTKNDNN
jgi:hypothetical protein